MTAAAITPAPAFGAQHAGWTKHGQWPALLRLWRDAPGRRAAGAGGVVAGTLTQASFPARGAEKPLPAISQARNQMSDQPTQV